MAGDKDVDAFVAAVDPPLRAILAALRAMIRETAPELREALFRDVPTYSLQDHVCYLAAYTDHVNLGFHHGAQIERPPRILEGTGKGMRHVKVGSVAEADTAALRALVRMAVAHDRPREARKARARPAGARRQR